MTGSPAELRSFLEAEMFFGVKKRERIAYAVAGGGLAIGLMGMIAVVTMLPLKQTEAFLAIVDKDTGVAERVVCEARGKNRVVCPVDGLKNADLVYERSRERCRFNVSWGFDDKAIWVDQGCRAEFLVN